jgi:hypothetical protein
MMSDTVLGPVGVGRDWRKAFVGGLYLQRRSRHARGVQLWLENMMFYDGVAKA